MSIRIDWHAPIYCPFFICDVCSERILAPEMAMAAWSEQSRHLGASDTYVTSHVHKGPCLEAYEEALPEGRTLMTAELHEHVAHLLRNTALSK